MVSRIVLRTLTIPLVFAFLLAVPSACFGAAPGHLHRILLLHSFEPFMPYSATVNQSIRQTLLEKEGERFEIYSEHLDLARFPGRLHEEKLASLLKEKYLDLRPDLVIAVLVPALDFALKYKKKIFNNAPVLYCGLDSSQAKALQLDRDVVGVLLDLEPKTTIEAALRLQPGTKRVVIVGGTSKNDMAFNRTVLRAFEEYRGRLEFVDLTGEPIEAIYQAVAKLEPGTIIFYITMFQDGKGKAHIPATVAGRLSNAASVPVYGLFDSYLGLGMVGGRLVSFEMQGKAAAEAGYRILQGENPGTVAQAPSPNAFMFDWRQLKKWRLDERNVPASSIVRYKQYTLWDKYKWSIIVIFAFTLLEASLIIFLLIQRTRRRRAEKELLLTQFSLDHASDAVIRLGPDGSFLYVNDATCRHYGFTREELLSMRVFDLNADMGPAAWQEFVTDVKEKKTKTFETRHMRKDGAVIPVEVRADQLEFHGEEQILAFMRDITERKQTEKEILDSRNFLQALLAASPVGICTIRDRTFEWASEFLCRATGYSPEELIGKNTRMFYESDAEFERAGEVLSEQGWTEVNTVRKDGVKIRSLLRIAAVDQSLWVVTMEDITQRKQLESQLMQAQKMEAVGTLAGGIAHDFNNILSVITGFAGLLRAQTPLRAPAETYIEQILTAAEKAVSLTTSLLAFSRKQIIDPKPVALNTAIEKTQKILSRLIGEDIEMRTILSAEDPVALVDESQLDQILINLVTNARDAMPNGGALTITAGITKIDDAFITSHGYGKTGKYATLSISDTGEGMDEKTRQRIFEPFFTTKEMGRGTGLGLSIIYGIVKQHNGYINVETAPRLGTTFSIYLPLVDTNPKLDQMAKDESLTGGTETILIGEDEESLRTFLRILLESVGYKVLQACDGEDVVRRFTDHEDRIDLVLLDVVMPKMNGWEVYTRLRDRKNDVSVIFCSGYTYDIIHQKGVDQEGLEFVQKPIMPDALLRKIRTVLDGSKIAPV